ncbi:MAG: hypothetical protein ACI9PY_000617 [Ascidiaceihabitans sp.]|jgi:hypothetical protein
MPVTSPMKVLTTTLKAVKMLVLEAVQAKRNTTKFARRTHR